MFQRKPGSPGDSRSSQLPTKWGFSRPLGATANAMESICTSNPTKEEKEVISPDCADSRPRALCM